MDFNLKVKSEGLNSSKIKVAIAELCDNEVG